MSFNTLTQPRRIASFEALSNYNSQTYLRIDPTPFRNDLQQWRERDVAATLNRNKQVEAANARVTALEGELAACRNKTAGLEEEAKGKNRKTQLT